MGQGDTGHDDLKPSWPRVWIERDTVPETLTEWACSDGAELLTLPDVSPWEAPGDGELVLLGTHSADALLLCARLKRPGPKRIAVVLVCDEAEAEFFEPVARFCMADAVLTRESLSEGAEGCDALARWQRRPGPRDSVDVLLARLDSSLGEDARALAERVVAGLSDERERSFVESATDGETGLFDGPFMAFKLEEEFKRSWRFGTPLSVLLIDLPNSRELGEERALILGQVAGVYLNECRDIDIIGRYDETSFLLLLPHTGEQGACVLADRILAKLGTQVSSPIPLDPAIAVVSVPRRGIERKDDLLDLARLTLVHAWAETGTKRVRLAQ